MQLIFLPLKNDLTFQNNLYELKKVNDLLLEHKVIFFRDQPITKDQQVALAEKFGPLETHAYVKGLDDYPEIVRIVKGKEEKRKTNGVKIGIVM